MGCGVSRLHADELLETRRKEFLLDGKAKPEVVAPRQHFQGITVARKSASSPDDSLTSWLSSSGKKESAKATKKEDEKEEKPLGKADGTAEGKEDGYAEDEGDDEEYDNDGKLGNKEGMIFPGSPSFRVYFIDNLDDDDDDDDSFRKKDGSKHTTQRVDHHTSQKMNIQQESVPKKAERGRKRRTLKKVMGGQSAVKNLFKGRSNYTHNPTCSPHNRSHLLPGKTPA